MIDPKRNIRPLRGIAACLMLVLPTPAVAQSVLPLSMPAPATETARLETPLGSYNLPTAAWADGTLPVQALEGKIEQTAWRLASGDAGTLQMFAALRGQLQQQGYAVLFECETEGCGGFDFRYELALLPEPEMHVDLGDFRYLSARKGEGAAALHIGLMVSRSREAGYLQVTTIAPADPATLRPSRTKPNPIKPLPDAAPDIGAIGTALERDGFISLDDLAFETGAATLWPSDYASLTSLAAYLSENPTRTITLVGHTDATGTLAANVALSRRRAEAVAEYLITVLGVAKAQIAADGVGYLAPRASNLTEQGRMQNRRVEAILTSTQ